MANSHQLTYPLPDEPDFEWTGGWRNYIRCRKCGRRGLPGGIWMQACRGRPHTFVCKCGKPFPDNGSLLKHISAHKRWGNYRDHSSAMVGDGVRGAR